MRGKVALVTGASSGVGRATVELLSSRGWTCVAVARRKERLEELAEACPNPVHVEAVDGADGQAVLDAAERVLRDVGVPDLIVNSAGAGEWRFIEESPPDDMQRMMGAPFASAYNFTHAFMDPMLARGSGVFIHIGSPASLVTWPGATAYTTSRWAMRGMHEALCQDLAGTGLRSVHLIFSEIDSEYFDQNADSHEGIPKIGKVLLPVLSTERCAEVVLRAAERPRNAILYPWQMRAVYTLYQLFPMPFRWLVRLTGKKRQKQN